VRSPRGEALQSHAWGEVKRLTGWEPRRYRIEDATGPLAVVSIQEQWLAAGVSRRLPRALRPLGAAARAAGRFVYAPAGPVLLRDDAETARRALLAVARIGRARNAALVVVDPNWPVDSPQSQELTAAAFTAAVRQVQISRTAMLLPLDSDDEAQHRRVNDRVARSINKARRAGVAVRRIDGTSPETDQQAALEAMYAMLAATAERRGFTIRGPDYVLPSLGALVRTGCASVWLAEHEGRDVASTLVHHSGERAVLFLAGAVEDDAGRNRTPANFLLQWQIIRWAAGEGFRSYDLGGVDTPDAPGMPRDEKHPLWGLFQFKSQWGAKPVEYAGAHEHAPRRALGALVRTGWRGAEAARRLRRRRRGGDD
jgi:lipid II:glycine glycyltransferase (peptidoglycan interpeptide bridge formation enzyme)